MIKANELRIGNYVLDVSPYELIFPVNGHHIFKASEDWGYRAVPLTSDVLEKCGFKNGRLNVTPKTAIVFDNIRKGCMIDTYGNSYMGWVDHITSLHQLQNLYFALTGQELKINL